MRVDEGALSCPKIVPKSTLFRVPSNSEEVFETCWSLETSSRTFATRPRLIPCKTTEFRSAVRKRIPINIDLDYGKMLTGDEKKIRQRLVILLDNTLKYSKEGNSINIASKEKNGMDSVTVTDTGIGMSDDSASCGLVRFCGASLRLSILSSTLT